MLDQMNNLLKRLKQQYAADEQVDKQLLQEILQKDFESVIINFKEEIMTSRSSTLSVVTLSNN